MTELSNPSIAIHTISYTTHPSPAAPDGFRILLFPRDASQ